MLIEWWKVRWGFIVLLTSWFVVLTWGNVHVNSPGLNPPGECYDYSDTTLMHFKCQRWPRKVFCHTCPSFALSPPFSKCFPLSLKLAFPSLLPGEVEDPDYDDCMACEEGCRKCVLCKSRLRGPNERLPTAERASPPSVLPTMFRSFSW